MRLKYPIEYELNPTEMDKGKQWLTLTLKNTGSKTLKRLDVELHSLDTFYLFPFIFPSGIGHYIGELKPNEEREVDFQVNANGSADVYATIRARKDGDYFGWESGWTHISVSEQKAEIGRLVVLSHPYTTIGKTLLAEATIKGLGKGTGLKLEFWVETPSGNFEKQATIDIKELSVGEEARYSAEFTPKETGYYIIYAYLYDGYKRISHNTDSIYAQEE
ncbi:MAG: hypothetical protein OEX06_02565 [Candidatus Bathyarchaeota archaeon]|nr:hypothetical protein [Candidatus Bathyarchaeota archaeon]MDH5702405.1 hypothetical protein [Candidatus Bathyarchaeota archaeon]